MITACIPNQQFNWLIVPMQYIYARLFALAYTHIQIYNGILDVNSECVMLFKQV